MNETSALKLLSKELLPGTVYDYCLLAQYRFRLTIGKSKEKKSFDKKIYEGKKWLSLSPTWDITLAGP